MAINSETLKKLFSNNWELKLMAFFLAVLTFLAIHGATNEELTYEVPVVVDVEEGIAVLDKDPPSVMVTFRGSLDDLTRIDSGKLAVKIRPDADESAGSEKVYLSRGDISGSMGARASKIIPGIVELTFDREDEQQFSVAKPVTIGTPLRGKVEIDYEPKVVSIRGPHQQLERMLEENVVIETEPVDVDERVKSFTRTVYAISPSETWVSKIEPEQIQVTVNIVTESISREWTNMPVLAIMKRGILLDADFTPAAVNLSLHGRPELVKSIEKEFIRIFVDCTELETNREYDIPVNVHLPPGSTDVTVTVVPDIVKVRLTEQLDKKKTKEAQQGNKVDGEEKEKG